MKLREKYIKELKRQAFFSVLFFILIISSLGILVYYKINFLYMEKKSQHSAHDDSRDVIDIVKRWRKDFSNYTYDDDSFNCENYSRKFLEFADREGFYCEEVVGCPDNLNPDDLCHNFVQCAIEPQSFNFVNYNGEFPLQRVEKR